MKITRKRQKGTLYKAKMASYVQHEGEFYQGSRLSVCSLTSVGFEVTKMNAKDD